MDEDLCFYDLPHDIIRHEICSHLDFESRNVLRQVNRELKNVIQHTDILTAIEEKYQLFHKLYSNTDIVIVEWMYDVNTNKNSRLCSWDAAYTIQQQWPGKLVYLLCDQNDVNMIQKIYKENDDMIDTGISKLIKYSSFGCFELRDIHKTWTSQCISTIWLKDQTCMYTYQNGHVSIITDKSEKKKTFVEMIAYYWFITDKIQKHYEFVTNRMSHQNIYKLLHKQPCDIPGLEFTQ